MSGPHNTRSAFVCRPSLSYLKERRNDVGIINCIKIAEEGVISAMQRIMGGVCESCDTTDNLAPVPRKIECAVKIGCGWVLERV
ncbi:hypothetical protein AB8615_06445 [Litorimonas sp. RW-G-Af-16]|uniref:hypothetical protein n=1 Tax=Litorimonas sp. RW-G-Af-16 TaxID=3241168 RepID=UPI003AACD10A